MKSIDKLKIMQEKITDINSMVLKNKTWKIVYVNKGANNYCLTINEKGKELFSGSFATYDSVISALSLIETMFDKSLNERK